jgi:type II secretory pathway pseudopilin PulG
VDIHPPHGSVNSFKDFFVHLLTVILGILIALSLEGLLEWRHHRSLAEEARSNLAVEIRENRQVVERGLAVAPDAEQRLKATIEVIEAYRKDHRDDRTSKLNWSFAMFPLSATAWSTASSTGALGYMDYSEVKGYTRAYVLQEEFLTMQQNTLGKWLDLQKWLARRDAKGSLSNLNNEELSQIEAETRLH